MTPQHRERLKKQHRDWIIYLILHSMLGILIGAIIGAALIWFNIAGLGQMVQNSSNPMGYALLLISGFAYTFGLLTVGTGVVIRSRDNSW